MSLLYLIVGQVFSRFKVIGSNNTFLRAKVGENSVTLVPDGEVILHHNNSVRAETSSTGLDVTGNLTATSFNVGTAATIAANGNATFSGIVTASNFVGDGSGLTGVANTDHVSSTTLSVSGVTTSTGGLKVGTAATIASNGNATFSGIVTATSFVGSGANLTGLPAGVTINTNADNRIITGSGTC